MSVRTIVITGLLLVCVSLASIFAWMRDDGKETIAVVDRPSTTSASDNRHRGEPLYDNKATAHLKQALLAAHVSPLSSDRATVAQSIKAPTVRIENGWLTVEAHNISLDKLLDAIAEKSGIAIYSEALNAPPVSIAFEHQPLGEGLRRILVHQDIFFLYGAGGSKHKPIALWVYPRGKGREMVPVPPENWASTSELEQALSSNPNAAARMRAVEAVIERKGAESMESVSYALADMNEQVRYSALSGALNVGLKLPEGTLENLAQYDRSHFVRSLALTAIAEAPSSDETQARSMAEAALADPHPDVRMQARDVLATLNQVDRPQALSETVNLYRRVLAK